MLSLERCLIHEDQQLRQRQTLFPAQQTVDRIEKQAQLDDKIRADAIHQGNMARARQEQQREQQYHMAKAMNEKQRQCCSHLVRAALMSWLRVSSLHVMRCNVLVVWLCQDE